MLKKVVALSSSLILSLGAICTAALALDDGNHLNSDYNYLKFGNVSGFSAYSSNPPAGEKAVTSCMKSDSTASWYLEVDVEEYYRSLSMVTNYNSSSGTSAGIGTNIPRDRTNQNVDYIHTGAVSPSNYIGFHIDSYYYRAYQVVTKSGTDETESIEQ